MKLTTAIPSNVSSAIESSILSMRTMLGLPAELAFQAAPCRLDAPKALPGAVIGLDDRLDAIRRAGL
jgi:hypothetical protein